MLSALELFDEKKYAQSMKVFIQLNTDPADVIKLFPELDNKPGSEDDSKLKGKDLQNALTALINYLVEVRLKIAEAVKKGSTDDKTPGTSSDSTSHRNVTQQLELIDTTLLKCYLQVK